MKYQFKLLSTLRVFIFFLATIVAVNAQRAPITTGADYTLVAKKIRTKYEQNAFKLKPSKAGHMGLRLWRNYKDDKYRYLLLQGINYTAGALDKLADMGLDEASLDSYVQKRNAKYKAKNQEEKIKKGHLRSLPQI